jgi:holliday junction DNA helicase RuvA
MIGRLRGEVVWRGADRVVLDVQGVGYELFGPARVLDGWAAAEGEVTAVVSTQVREDAITLYAFESFDEREVFLTLLSVNKVGAKLALATLDTLEPAALHRAVETDDVPTLCRIPGVGKRTAQRLALELKGKLPLGAFAPTAPARTPARPAADPLALGLERLGWTRAEIEAARARIAEAGLEGAPVGEQLRHALRTSLSG